MEPTYDSLSERPIGIVGAGPVGALLACFLAKSGISSEIYERRTDLRLSQACEGRSINLAVSTRGLHALEAIGLKDHVLSQAIPMKGRMIHDPSGNLSFHPYSIYEKDCIYSMSRSGLNKVLINRAEATGKVQIHFQKRATAFELDSNTLCLRDEQKGEDSRVQHPIFIGTDGAASVIRTEMMKQPGYHCSQDYLEYGYKELTLPAAGSSGEFLMEKNALHIWPRGAYMLIALPNLDGSFTCTLFLALKGRLSFESLDSPTRLREFFQAQFPDMISMMPDFSEQFFSNPTGHMVTVKCSPWSSANRLLLLGDAAHAIVPFFGQGMNCGFEDCYILSQILEESGDLSSAISQFGLNRKQNTDAIADMAIENFLEMRDKVARPAFLMEKSVETILQKHFPQDYLSRYALVTFSRVPYRLAYQVGIVEGEILSELCKDLQRADEVDLEKAAVLINEKLRPLVASQKGLQYGPSN